MEASVIIFFNILGDILANFLSISYSSNPIENPLNKVNYEGPMGHIMANVGETGGPSAYGTFDQNGNVEEWTNTINDKKIRVCGGYAGCDLSLLDAKFRDDFEDSNFDLNFLLELI